MIQPCAHRISRLRSLIIRFREPLYRNSVFIMLTSLLGSCIGFAFWVIAARCYASEEIGIATALISSISLTIFLSRVGLEHSLIRFAPESDGNTVFSTTAFVTTLLSIAFGVAFIAVAEGVLEEVPPFGISSMLYLTFVIAQSLVSLSGTTFIAHRKAKYYLLQNVASYSRLLPLALLIPMGYLGVFSSYGIGLLVALTFSIPIALRTGIRLVRPSMKYLRHCLRFSVNNYLVEILIVTPNMMLPIMVVSVLGATESAKYYIAYAVASVTMVIPSAVSTSLFVEGSHGRDLREYARKSIAIVLALLVPVAFTLFVFGDLILALFGTVYLEAFTVLRLMIVSVFFIGVFSVYVSVKRVQKAMGQLILMSAYLFAAIMGFSYLFLIKYGITGVGYAWLLAYASVACMVGFSVQKERRARNSPS